VRRRRGDPLILRRKGGRAVGDHSAKKKSGLLLSEIERERKGGLLAYRKRGQPKCVKRNERKG